MADRATIAHTMALLALLSVTLHLQAQGARESAASDQYVLLEPKGLQQLPAAAVNALNATDSVCDRCRCCLPNTNPQVCLTTCCFRRICGDSVCSLPTVSCGCNGCDYPPGKK